MNDFRLLYILDMLLIL